MAKREPSKENVSDGKATFASGLGADFKPLDKRIRVRKAVDASPLKVKPQQGRDENGS